MKAESENRSIAALRTAARACLEECDLDRKVGLTRDTFAAWRKGAFPPHCEVPLNRPHTIVPGLPARLVLTEPTKVPRRGLRSRRGLAAFVHSIAHIEWNAINLAWDAVWRFDGMPVSYYDDWTSVAAEEALHFELLRGRLRELGSDYGELPAHAGLWQMAESTTDDPLRRMALVPRVLEARGLDVTPALIEKLRAAGDERTSAILRIILLDEIGHVRIGSRWFHHLCRERRLDPAATFASIVRTGFRGRPRPSGDRALRREAGFLDDELDALARLAEQDEPQVPVAARSGSHRER